MFNELSPKTFFGYLIKLPVYLIRHKKFEQKSNLIFKFSLTLDKLACIDFFPIHNVVLNKFSSVTNDCPFIRAKFT